MISPSKRTSARAQSRAFRVLLAWLLVAATVLIGSGVRLSHAQIPPILTTPAPPVGTPAMTATVAPEAPAVPTAATPPPPPGASPAPTSPGAVAGQVSPPKPFGWNLFIGNFLSARQNGLNPNYVIMPGDQVGVHVWGALDFNQVLTVDSQGNVFLPTIGPIQLAGVPNRELTAAVKGGLGRVYSRYFDVYTNLLTPTPVAVYVTGSVPRPGRYAGVPSDSLLFFLDQAGGIDPVLGSYRRVKVLREGKAFAEVDLYDFIMSGKITSPQFKDGDVVLVERRGPVVELGGNVAAPAMLEFREPKFSGADALAVVPGSARATEVTVEGIREGRPFVQTLSLKEFAAVSLRDGDRIRLREEGRADSIVVKLEGEYDGVSELSVQRGSRLVDVLNHVAVRPKLSNVRAVHLRRTAVARAQKESIEDSLFRLERSALLALSSTVGETEIRVREAELTQKFVERARLIQPLGRVVTVRSGRQRNILLEEGDVIVIPQRTNVVRVGGEVMMAQAVMYRPGMKAKHFIRDAGGYSERADHGKVIILHADAQVEIGDPGTRIMPGDEVLVPPRIDKKILQNAADVVQVVYQIAVSAGVILAVN